ncbi:DNA-directed RNA polymerase subunit beta [Lactococcus protaetiae]|uniref:DNA-directed RNA polymerase subunit beta n=1 Tax=Lactococcus protaetiae TaxID=2592653 RepID=A0A514Z7W6_9LACT|nr:DNA-directed RNA polymerase subunit beta [Lactococcus protaetiae]MCL2113315.1 DNA-directed RNA polymerase subunit beta [Streptococcaceae bacterium]QDK70686.1 DNA-directed RNA polymerase subunit beta [Lactococcus protaetiae]
MFKRTVKFLGVRLSFVILIAILLVVSAVLGLMLGYGVLGGGNPSHVFNHNLWTEVLDKLNPAK